MPPIPAPIIQEAPIWPKANSNRPLDLPAPSVITNPSEVMNSGWFVGKNAGSKFKYGL